MLQGTRNNTGSVLSCFYYNGQIASGYAGRFMGDWSLYCSTIL